MLDETGRVLKHYERLEGDAVSYPRLTRKKMVISAILMTMRGTSHQQVDAERNTTSYGYHFSCT